VYKALYSSGKIFSPALAVLVFPDFKKTDKLNSIVNHKRWNSAGI
jgi:hypothetical protein